METRWKLEDLENQAATLAQVAYVAKKDFQMEVFGVPFSFKIKETEAKILEKLLNSSLGENLEE